MSNTVSIIGMDDIKKVLEDITPKHADNLMRSTIFGVATDIRKEAKAKAPKGQTGNLKRSIKARRKKSPPDKPTSIVYVDKKGFYWKFVEHGTGGKSPQPARPFIRPAKEKIMAALPQYLKANFGKKLESLLKKQRKKIDSGKYK